MAVYLNAEVVCDCGVQAQGKVWLRTVGYPVTFSVVFEKLDFSNIEAPNGWLKKLGSETSFVCPKCQSTMTE